MHTLVASRASKKGDSGVGKAAMVDIQRGIGSFGMLLQRDGKGSDWAADRH